MSTRKAITAGPIGSQAASCRRDRNRSGMVRYGGFCDPVPARRTATPGRNILRGPGATNLDLALQSFPGDRPRRAGWSFAAEFFNALNHTNFGLPGELHRFARLWHHHLVSFRARDSGRRSRGVLAQSRPEPTWPHRNETGDIPPSFDTRDGTRSHSFRSSRLCLPRARCSRYCPKEPTSPTRFLPDRRFRVGLVWRLRAGRSHVLAHHRRSSSSGPALLEKRMPPVDFSRLTVFIEAFRCSSAEWRTPSAGRGKYYGRPMTSWTGASRSEPRS